MPVETNNKKQMKSPKSGQFSGSFLILLTLLLVLNFILPSFLISKSPQIPYSTFLAEVEAGKVDRAIVSSDRIEYTIKTQTPDGKFKEQGFVTTPVGMDFMCNLQHHRQTKMRGLLLYSVGLHHR
jgi:cell division protease FtsH